MLVYQGQAEKGTVYDKHASQFTAVYTALEDLSKKRAEVQATIQQLMAPFSQIVSQAHGDQQKQQFYQQLDQAISYYNELMNMLHQGSQFYQQLSDYLTKLFQK